MDLISLPVKNFSFNYKLEHQIPSQRYFLSKSPYKKQRNSLSFSFVKNNKGLHLSSPQTKRPSTSFTTQSARSSVNRYTQNPEQKPNSKFQFRNLQGQMALKNYFPQGKTIKIRGFRGHKYTIDPKQEKKNIKLRKLSTRLKEQTHINKINHPSIEFQDTIVAHRINDPRKAHLINKNKNHEITPWHISKEQQISAF